MSYTKDQLEKLGLSPPEERKTPMTPEEAEHQENKLIEEIVRARGEVGVDRASAPDYTVFQRQYLGSPQSGSPTPEWRKLQELRCLRGTYPTPEEMLLMLGAFEGLLRELEQAKIRLPSPQELALIKEALDETPLTLSDAKCADRWIARQAETADVRLNRELEAEVTCLRKRNEELKARNKDLVQQNKDLRTRRPTKRQLAWIQGWANHALMAFAPLQQMMPTNGMRLIEEIRDIQAWADMQGES